MEAEESTKVASSSPPPPTHYETLVSETESNLEEEGDVDGIGDSKPTSFDQKEILRALEVLERDSVAIAQSFTSLFASLRLALSEVTSSSVDHMQCFSDAAGRLQECALDAATKGNHHINSCVRLNEEMKGIDRVAGQLKILKRNVDTLDSNVNRLLLPP
ncbi:uncharacterized protein LOC130753085 [Actinidia eriantha]|uniref:uncharacterized protein LOC130753085 n=1 Tax=Actinidia eriantha TaxID=165200 RepID=UPI00258A10D2|nr:uncharacterized protein LOC130753085 [Actinidia eriantha]